MKKILGFILSICFIFSAFIFSKVETTSQANADSTKNYFTVYSDETKKKVLFLKGDDVSVGDMYLSSDNKLYEISSVDEKNKEGIAKFLKDETLPKYNVSRKVENTEKVKNAEAHEKTFAKNNKKVGIYHTHNDECYFTPDGIDSVYGKGGIHDVGKKFVSELNNIGVETVYREDLHLPHNSGAYTRSQVTATALLDSGATAIFDLHRDSTKRSEYLTKVDGKEMSSIRMVVGSASTNYEANKKFAYSIKGYADKVYPGLIKDIYIGKGNYNQQLSNRAMLFEFGCENIEKDYAIKASEYLAKTIDVVLYGTENASQTTLNDVTVSSDNGSTNTVTGLVNDSNSTNSNTTLYIILGIIGSVIIVLAITLAVSKKARYKVGRFFSEMFAGLFGKKSTK